MRITITKGQADDTVAVVRADGTECAVRFPRKGPVPHDAVHLLVEAELDLDAAFWGMIAAGRHPDEIAGLAHAAGHPSAARAGVPDPAFIELLQAERMVECFEADLWSGGSGDPAALLELAAIACADSLVPPPPVSTAQVHAVRERLNRLAAEWIPARPGYQVRFDWPEGD